MEDIYIDVCATYEVNAINHVTLGTVHIFNIFHWTNIVATLQTCSNALLLQCTYRFDSSTHMTENSVSDTKLQSNGHRCEKNNMATKCKLTAAMTNK